MKTAIQTRDAPAAIGTYSQAVKVGAEAGGFTVYLSGQIGLDPATMQLAEANRPDEALEAYRKGIEAAEKKGDKQAGKEMAVYARRLEKRRG